jgi:hypothetical protein
LSAAVPMPLFPRSFGMRADAHVWFMVEVVLRMPKN